MTIHHKTTAPVLFIVFNRPDTTKQVFEKIRLAKPSQLFIAADAPRKDRIGEAEKCEEVKKIVADVDWVCEVKTLFQHENKGCGSAVSEAISWFFEQVEYGIILEDDCLPDISFFGFCSEILERFKNDTRIMHINGGNSLLGNKINQYSYYFSTLISVWGWATWRRAWKHFDFFMNTFPEYERENFIACRCPDVHHAGIQLRKFQHKFNDKNFNIWGYQWQYAIVSQSGLIVCPMVNLVKNIGFGEDATQTSQQHHLQKFLKLETLNFPLKHPNIVAVSYNADLEVIYKWLPPKPLSFKQKIFNCVPPCFKEFLKKLLGKKAPTNKYLVKRN